MSLRPQLGKNSLKLLVRITDVTQFLLATICLLDAHSVQAAYQQTGCQPHPALDLELCQPKVGEVQFGDVTEGSVCPLVREDGVIDRMVCRDGEWRMEGHTGWGLQDVATSQVFSNRHKRDVITLDVSLVPGNQNTTTIDDPQVITCPLVAELYPADKGKLTTKVTWTLATAYDPQDGKITPVQVQGQSPGSDHPAGNHVITFVAKDSSGLTSLCSVNFTVKVYRCPFQSTYLYNGRATCTNAEDANIYGSECQYSCDPGYQLTGASSVQCLKNETWSAPKPTCKAITCGQPSQVQHGVFVCSTPDLSYGTVCNVSCSQGYSVIGGNGITCLANKSWTSPGQCVVKSCTVMVAPSNGQVTCSNENIFGSVCSIKCDSGYQLDGDVISQCLGDQTWSGHQPTCIPICPKPPAVSHGQYVCNGQRSGDSCSLTCESGYLRTSPVNIYCSSEVTWSQPGYCLDTEPPTFPYGCTPNMVTSAPALGTSTLVNYSLPDVLDNSGENLKLVGDPASGSAFGIGVTMVTLTASDRQNNTVTCRFNVTVKSLYCNDPNTSADGQLVYNCSDGFVYGAVCSVTCSNGSLPHGASNIRCEKIPGYDQVQWTWAGNVGPYCQDVCQPGQFSPNGGRQPCTPCGRGTFQPNSAATFCEICPYGMSTLNTGATSQDECENFDLFVIINMTYPYIKIYDDRPQQLTMMSWIYLQSQEPKMNLEFSLQPRTGAAYLTLDAIGLYLLPVYVPDSRNIRKWYHFALVYVNENVTLYLDGKPVANFLGLWVKDLQSKTIKLTFEGNAFLFVENKIILSSVQLTPVALSAQEVQEFVTSCKKKVTQNALGAHVVDTALLKPSSCDTYNDCVGDPCGDHGTCFDGPDDFTCVCDQGWSGRRCQIPPDYCRNSACANGSSCVNLVAEKRYSCSCMTGFTGLLCDQTVANGGWGEWSTWRACSTSCGLGQRSRIRQCDNPPPDQYGLGCLGLGDEVQLCYGFKCPVDGNYGGWSEWSPCSASCGGGTSTRRRVCDSPAASMGGTECDVSQATSSRKCNSVECPKCLPLTLRSGHKTLDCTDNTYKTETTCSIVCKPGLTLVSGVVNSFKCGIANSYMWSHQTELNPSAILPDCSETKRPSAFQLELKFSYKNMSISSLQQMEDILQEILVERVECISADICSYNMSVVCSTCSDRDRSLSQDIVTVDVQVMLVVMMNFSRDAGPPKYLSSLSESERVVEVAAARSLFQLTNNTEALLQLNVSHVQYNVSVMSAKMSATCQDGAVLVDGFCVDCPSGTHVSVNNACVVCSIGFYQNETRSRICKECPTCKNTTSIGSYQIEQCEAVGGVCNSTAEHSNSSVQTISMIVGIICGAGALIIIIVIVTLIVTRKKRRRNSIPNPYAIPDKYVDEDPYATLPADNPYDVIPDNPTQEKDEGFESAGYICAVDKVTDSCDSQFLHSANTANYLLVNGRPEVRNVDDYLKVVDALNGRPTSNSLPDYLQIIDGANDGPLNDTLDDYLHVIDAVNNRQIDDNSDGSMDKLNSLKDLDDAVGDVYNPLYTKVKRESGTKVGNNNAVVPEPEVVFDMEERPPDLPPKRHVLPTDMTDTKGDNTETGSDTVEHQVYNTAL
ncbi:uncharacterized protein LOC131931220 [Physella acuta]|uniref:uncharacterized protein LOC131931220 n=1 Tax=Physella acuta TaxID=109671 RepID=UPI0027DAF7DD|nr:uncharacterized protein LOC131931220 [Physella acuta]